MSATRQTQIFLLLFASAALFRLPALATVPPPLHWDEASRVYDAWCLLETGADRHGDARPLFLKSFGEGDWTASLTTWLTVPFVALFGPGAWAARLPDALLGVLTVAALSVFLLRLLGPAPALVGTAILALDPWHISLCRTGQEAGFAPFFFIMALLGLQQGGLLAAREPEPDAYRDRTRERADLRPDRAAAVWALVAGLMLALHAWVYPATRLFTPLFAVALFATHRHAWRARFIQNQEPLAALCIGAVIGSAPLWLTALSHPERLAARGRVTLFAAEGLSIGERVVEFVRNYAANFSPVYQFIRSDEMSGMTVRGSGLHLVAAAPLALIGLWAVLRGCRISPWNRLLLAWLALYPLPAAICRDWNPHPFRTVAGMLLVPLFAAHGWHWLANRTATWSRRARRYAGVAAALALALNAGWFADVYFRRMPGPLERGYQTALVRAMQFAGAQERADFILVTRWMNQPYIYALLYGPVRPDELPALPRLEGADTLGFHQFLRIGRFFFPPREPDRTPELTAAFQQAFSALAPDAEGLVIEEAGRFGGGELLATFRNGEEPAAGPPLEVRRWRRSEDPRPVGPDACQVPTTVSTPTRD